MTLEGAIKLSETNEYVIYTMNSVTTGQYGVVLPSGSNGTLNMLVDLHMKGSFDAVGAGSKTKDMLISEITEEYNKLKTKYLSGILVMPMIDEAVFQNTVNNADKQKMFDEVKKIGAITSELYKKLTEQGVDKQRIDQKIIIVEKPSEDEKFVNWLKEQSQMTNFVDGVLYSSFSVTSNNNSLFGDNNNSLFGDNNSIFGPNVSEPVNNVEPAPVAGAPVTPVENNNSIFGTTTNGVTNNVETVTPTASTIPAADNSNSIFGESVSNSNNSIFAPAEPVSPTVTVEPVSPVTAQPVSAPVQNSTVQNTSVAQEPVINMVPPVVEGPKPVESAMLEGTIAFTPIPNHPNNQYATPEVQNTNNEEDEVEGTPKSKGFVNLAIILVVLAGVTIASIELGKYLYSVFGA